MANALFDNAKQEFLSGSLDLPNNDIKLDLFDTDDGAVSVSADSFRSDLTATGIVATSGNFTTKSVTDGTFDADDVTLTSVSGDQAEAIIIYQDTGTDSSSTLLVYIDSATGLPVTPNDGDITITWDAAGIFSL